MEYAPPGKGPWELENTHHSRPTTSFVQEVFPPGFVRGFGEGTARFGVLLDHLEPRFVNGFVYQQPVAFGAPEGAMGPPPKPILMALARLHAAMRKRIAAGVAAIEKKLWREDLRLWDEVDKPTAIAKHRALQGVDVEALSNDELANHLADCAAHVTESIYIHHKYTIPATLPMGDFLAGAMEWTGLPSGELLSLLRGTSAISRGFAANELDDAAKAISESDTARSLLWGSAGSQDNLDALRAHAEAGPAVAAYLDAVQWRSVGYVEMLRGGAGPGVVETTRRHMWRTTHTTDDAPPFLRVMPAPAPPAEWFPAKARRSARAVGIFLANPYGVAESPNTKSVLTGLAVNTGVYEGTARLVTGAADFDRIRPGDVLVTKMTSPYFNVVLPTARCHRYRPRRPALPRRDRGSRVRRPGARRHPRCDHEDPRCGPSAGGRAAGEVRVLGE